ncbi:Fur-regulated basic protein FbpA [Niallia sp. 01092]|uniref:Fur-regulated basic protein FbpA n=1 Tax=unclassified Niallia TaxID=2837522 RepID=UPI003FD008FD
MSNEDLCQKRRMLINKLVCFGNDNITTLNNLSLKELQEKYHQFEFCTHPHFGAGSLIWRKGS